MKDDKYSFLLVNHLRRKIYDLVATSTNCYHFYSYPIFMSFKTFSENEKYLYLDVILQLILFHSKFYWAVPKRGDQPHMFGESYIFYLAACHSFLLKLLLSTVYYCETQNIFTIKLNRNINIKKPLQNTVCFSFIYA